MKQMMKYLDYCKKITSTVNIMYFSCYLDIYTNILTQCSLCIYFVSIKERYAESTMAF